MCNCSLYFDLQNSGRFKRSQSLKEQNGSGNKVRDFFITFSKDKVRFLIFLMDLSDYFLMYFLHPGPHFVEYLDFAVTQECDVLLKCKVRNVTNSGHLSSHREASHGAEM